MLPCHFSLALKSPLVTFQMPPSHFSLAFQMPPSRFSLAFQMSTNHVSQAFKMSTKYQSHFTSFSNPIMFHGIFKCLPITFHGLFKCLPIMFHWLFNSLRGRGGGGGGGILEGGDWRVRSLTSVTGSCSNVCKRINRICERYTDPFWLPASAFIRTSVNNAATFVCGINNRESYRSHKL